MNNLDLLVVRDRLIFTDDILVEDLVDFVQGSKAIVESVIYGRLVFAPLFSIKIAHIMHVLEQRDMIGFTSIGKSVCPDWGVEVEARGGVAQVEGEVVEEWVRDVLVFH